MNTMHHPSIEISCVTEPKEEYVAAVSRLLKQLTSRPIVFGQADLEQLVASPSSQLYLARIGDRLVGMATVGAYLCPTGKKYWLEDVVVDEAYRGQGIARTLIAGIIERLSLGETDKLYLTSNPARVAANHLYQSMGFHSKTTNVYYK